MARSGQRLGLIEKSLAIGEPLLETTCSSLRHLAPDGDVAGGQTRGELRLEERQRFLVQPLLFQNFSFEGGKAPIPFGLPRGDGAERRVGTR